MTESSPRLKEVEKELLDLLAYEFNYRTLEEAVKLAERLLSLHRERNELYIRRILRQ